MAPSADARALTLAHRVAQARLGALTAAQLEELWTLLDPEDLDATIARWLRAAVPVIQTRYVDSAKLAGAYYQGFRQIELGTTAAPFAPIVATEADVPAIVTSLTVTGPVRVKTLMASGSTLDRAMAAGRSASGAAGMRHSLEGGRSTVLESTARDPRAGKWERVTGGNACEFCTMLEDRGAVYTADSADFETHDHCQCTAEPSFD